MIFQCTDSRPLCLAFTQQQRPQLTKCFKPLMISIMTQFIQIRITLSIVYKEKYNSKHRRIIARTRQRKYIKVVFICAPSHVGIEGNKLPDRTVKKSIEKPSTDQSIELLYD